MRYLGLALVGLLTGCEPTVTLGQCAEVCGEKTADTLMAVCPDQAEAFIEKALQLKEGI